MSYLRNAPLHIQNVCRSALSCTLYWLVFQVLASPGAGVPQWGGGHRVHLGEGDIEYVSRHLELFRELYLELSRTI